MRRLVLGLCAVVLLVACEPQKGTQVHGLWGDWSDSDRTTVLNKLDPAVGWIRVDVGWLNLEPSNNNYDSAYLAKLDGLVNGAQSRGIEVLLMPWATPGWANGNRDRTVPPNDLGEYARFVGWLADHFQGRVGAYEIWNEEDHPDFWQGSVGTYVDMLRRSYLTIKAEDTATVVTGGTTYNNDAWVSQLYNSGAGGYFDAVATHPYMSPSDLPPETPDDGTKWRLLHVNAVTQVMDAHGDSDLPVWFTEFGWSSHANTSSTPNWERGVSLATQADYLTRTFNLINNQLPRVTLAFWYAARDRVDSGIQNNNYGLLTYNLGEKPSYAAMRDWG